jgi:hypothetical protein
MGAYLSKPGAGPTVTISIVGSEARALAAWLKEELIKENRRRAHHGDSRIRYTVLFEEFEENVKPVTEE